MARDARRLKMDIALLGKAYDPASIFWPQDFSWIKVENFELPGNFKQRRSNILVLVPDNYGFGGCFRDIFLTSDLELLDREGKSYRKLDRDIHGFRVFPYSTMTPALKNTFLERNWLYLCLHDTNPKSSLLSYLHKTRIFLGNPYRDWSAINAVN